MNIILASSSQTRQKQIQALGIPFSIHNPDIDEKPLANESAAQLVLRLSIEKAKAVANRIESGLIIAGDQVCVCEQEIVGKPHNRENAIAQLERSSGKTLRFYSGTAVLNSQQNQLKSTVVTTDVTFRHLSREEIESYVDKAQPFYCAGSFNVEGLGISLFEKISSDDPSALLGLPMISVISFLNEFQAKLL